MHFSGPTRRVLLVCCTVLLSLCIAALSMEAKLCLYRDSHDISQPFGKGIKLMEIRKAKLVADVAMPVYMLPLPETVGEKAPAAPEADSPRIVYCSQPSSLRAPPLS